MRKELYIFLLAIVVLASGCASTGEYSKKRDLAKAELQQQVISSIESGNYVIRVNKLFTRRYSGMDLKPGNNYVLIENDKARINLAYVGRSYTTRAVSGINFTGIVEEKTITAKKKGSNIISMKIRGGGELFNVYIRISASGYCNISINNPRLDSVSYRGNLGLRQ